MAPQQCPGAIAPILARAQSRNEPFLHESAEDPQHQARRAEITTHSAPTFPHTEREPLCGLLPLQGTAPTLVGLGPCCSPPCCYCLMILRGNLWEKPRSVQRDFSGFPSIQFCCRLWGCEVHSRSPGRFRWAGPGAGGAPCLASALDLGHRSMSCQESPLRGGTGGGREPLRLEQGFWAVNYFPHLQNLGGHLISPLGM